MIRAALVGSTRQVFSQGLGSLRKDLGKEQGLRAFLLTYLFLNQGTIEVTGKQQPIVPEPTGNMPLVYHDAINVTESVEVSPT